jgi:hypothetical protein
MYLPCCEKECEKRIPPFSARHTAVIPWLSLTFFIAPVFWALGYAVYLVWGTGSIMNTAPDIISVGFFKIPRSELIDSKQRFDFILVLFITLVAFSSNMLRLYLSMWLTEEAYWESKEDPSQSAPRFYKEGLWRLVAFLFLYLSGWLCFTTIPFEWLILGCYIVCVIWDLLAVYKKGWYGYSEKLPEIKNALRNWLKYDIGGCIATLLYILVQTFLPLSAKVTWLTFGFLSAIYVWLLLRDWNTTKYNNGHEEVSCYTALLKRDLVII